MEKDANKLGEANKLGIEPRAAFVQDIAIWDPVAAYGIVLGIPRVPLSFSTQAIFSNFSQLCCAVEGDSDFRQFLCQRTWIDNMAFSVQQPNVFAGSVFKTLYDAMLRQAPGAAVRVAVLSGPRYVVASQFTPIENFALLFAARWPAGWPLFECQGIKVEFILTQSPPAIEPNAPPYIITLTFNAWQFLDPTIDEIDPEVAAECLRKMGFFVPVVRGCGYPCAPL